MHFPWVLPSEGLAPPLLLGSLFIRFATLACSAFSEQKPALINQAAHDKIEKIVTGVALSAGRDYRKELD